MDLELRKTKDGSHTLYRVDLNETYHSVHGAIQESKHVFIQNGLDFFYQSTQAKKINVYELGFGTGLNALLSMQWTKCHPVNITYYTSEIYVLDLKVIDQLNIGQLLNDNQTNQLQSLHHATHNHWNHVTPAFNFYLDTRDILHTKLSASSFDVIYFDAFAPNKQPGLWGRDVLKNMYDSLKQNGILVTYCAKGQVKRDLRSVGFKVETLQGPPGKREMIRAIKG